MRCHAVLGTQDRGYAAHNEVLGNDEQDVLVPLQPMDGRKAVDEQDVLVPLQPVVCQLQLALLLMLTARQLYER